VVKPGDIVKVKVLDVDIPRKRISLTLRLDDEKAPQGQQGQQGGGGERRQRGGRPPQQRQQQRQAPPPANSAMADALRKAGLLDSKKKGR
ncbi:MAG: RNA-binding transcriptional accessory protein, partial [Streptomyces sp.]|nr:RNA-binding transcriptional accessory protein [Streptomyces sp.]